MVKRMIQVAFLLILTICLSGCATFVNWVLGATEHSLDKRSLLVRERPNGGFEYSYDENLKSYYFFFKSLRQKTIKDVLDKTYVEKHAKVLQYSGPRDRWSEVDAKRNMILIEGCLPLYHDIDANNFFPNRKCAIWPSKGDPYIYLPEKWHSYIKMDTEGNRWEYEDVTYRKIGLPITAMDEITYPKWLLPVKVIFTPVTLAFDIPTLPLQYLFRDVIAYCILAKAFDW